MHNRISSSDNAVAPRKTQQGVVRINCIDCLDRTNYTQFCVASCVLFEQVGHYAATACVSFVSHRSACGWTQLKVTSPSRGRRLEDFPDLVAQLKKMFMTHGDRIVCHPISVYSAADVCCLL